MKALFFYNLYLVIITASDSIFRYTNFDVKNTDWKAFNPKIGDINSFKWQINHLSTVPLLGKH